jgi:anaerobic selenocysteine-containing dehydrogenase
MAKLPIHSVLDRLGLHTHEEEWRYAVDPKFGVMSARKIPERWVKTTCGYCSVGCGMLIGVRDGKAISVKGDPDHPVNEGKLCPKGLSEHYTISADGRALYPLLRSWRGQRRIGWDEALSTFATRLRQIQAKHGKDSFAVLSTGQLVSEEFYTLGKLVQLGFGTKNYDGNTTLCMASAAAGYKRSFGSDGPPGCYDDLERAETIVLIGANIADNHPILAYRLFRGRDRNPNQKLIVIDPRATKTAMLADLFLPIRPRSDVHLLNGVARVLIDEGWVDETFVAEHTSGFEELKAHLARYDLSYTAKVTGLSEGAVYEFARSIGRGASTLFAWTMGVNHSTQGTETVNVICNLAMLSGNVGKVGGAPFSITGQCNAMGSREMSFTSALPGYRKFEREADRQELASLWGVAEERIPTARGLAYPDIIQGVLDGRIKGLWIIATNPLVSYPDQVRLRKALAQLEFLVVQDGYHPTPTGELAHLMLPAAIWGEKEGTYTNSERRVSKVNAAVAPPGEARPDFQIFLDLAEQLGVKDELFPGWKAPQDAFEEWRKASRGRLCDYSALDYALLDQHSVQWPYSLDQARDPKAYVRLYEGGGYRSDDGKARFFVVKSELPPEEPCPDYPFMLNTGRTVEHWHTRTKTGRVPILERAAPEAWLEINPKDAERLQVANHDWVTVESRRGKVERVRARVTSIVGPGHVFMPFHFAETNANNLTIDAACPISREPNFKQAAVKVERVRL